MFAASRPSSRVPLKQQQRTAGEALHTVLLQQRADNGAARTIAIRMADSEGQRSHASMLVNRKYSQRGYGSHHDVPVAPNCVTFTASSEDHVIGTLSLTVDSPAGLALDRTFKAELDEFRKTPGVRICELTKFAVDCSESPMKLLASLFHIIFIYGTCKFGGTDLFVEVAPRHARFYEAMLGFKRVGTGRNENVGSPAVLLWLRAEDIRSNIDAYAGKKIKGTHSLYTYFFSPKEEQGVFNRLVAEVENFGISPIFNPVLAPSARH